MWSLDGVPDEHDNPFYVSGLFCNCCMLHHIEPANIISGWCLLLTHPRTLIAIFTLQHKSHFTQLSFVLAMFCFVLLWGSLCRSNLCLHHLVFWHCRPPLSVMVQCTKYCRWPKDETHSTAITSQNQRKLGNIQIVLNAGFQGGIHAVEVRPGNCHECQQCHWIFKNWCKKQDKVVQGGFCMQKTNSSWLPLHTRLDHTTSHHTKLYSLVILRYHFFV